MVFVFRILTREKMKKQRKRKIENTKNLISMRRPIYSRVEVEGFFRGQVDKKSPMPLFYF